MNAVDEILPLLNVYRIAPNIIDVVDDLAVINIGLLPYVQVRELQAALVEMRGHNRCSDVILTCEHPEVVTVGRREQLGEIVTGLLGEHNIPIIAVDRGGKATYHGPGQIVVYPVISLRARGLGVRSFVLGVLKAFAFTLEKFEIHARALIDPAGVWVSDNVVNGSVQFLKERKIASVGLRIQNGVTNHGFSLNYDCSLEPYKYFTPCGLAKAKMTSITKESRGDINKHYLLKELCMSFQFLSSK